MTLEDPFFVVKDEVLKAVAKTEGLYERWKLLQEQPHLVAKEDFDWTVNELRNSLRSIDWDLDDLEETVGIVEKNPKKFKLDDIELANRKAFIDKTKEEIKAMKDRVFESKNKEKKMRQGYLSSTTVSNAKYTRLQNELESPNERYIKDATQTQQVIVKTQEEELDRLHDSVGTLKAISKQIGSEIEEQAVMLDDLGHEIDNTQSRLDGTMKKMAKALHLTNDRRQWMAIGVLSGVMVIVIALFFVL